MDKIIGLESVRIKHNLLSEMLCHEHEIECELVKEMEKFWCG